MGMVGFSPCRAIVAGERAKRERYGTLDVPMSSPKKPQPPAIPCPSVRPTPAPPALRWPGATGPPPHRLALPPAPPPIQSRRDPVVPASPAVFRTRPVTMPAALPPRPAAVQRAAISTSGGGGGGGGGGSGGGAGSGGKDDDEMYRQYLAKQSAWGKKADRDTKYTVNDVAHMPGDYRRIRVKIAGTESVVATCQVKYDNDRLELSEMAVQEEHRSRGLTYLLIKAA